MISSAIDQKSPDTGGHCQRVPVLTMLLAEAATEVREGPLAAFAMTDRDRYELKIAALLHDCGKVTTPVHVVSKATKLETIWDRIHLIDTRFEVLKRDAKIQQLEERALAVATGSSAAALAAIDQHHHDRVRRLDEAGDFLRACNVGSEGMAASDQERVREIAGLRWTDTSGREADFLSPDEVENLTVRAGTLTREEREIVNHHIIATLKMLEPLPWPKHLERVPEFAGGHHERVDGSGYPKGLKREQMSVQARAMGIADIFEALTAKDRPYKKGMSLAQALEVLGKMSADGHIDPDLFEVFLRAKVYRRYAEQFLDPGQIDAVDESRIPGHSGFGSPRPAHRE